MNIPFYKSESRRCAQAAMKSVLKAVIPDSDFSFQQLDDLTHRKQKEITFLCQIAAGFFDIGIKFDYFTKPRGLEIVLGSRLVEISEEFYGESAEELLKKTNLESLKKSARVVLENGCFTETCAKPSLAYLEAAIQQERIPICLINYDVLVDRGNKFGGHYVVVTGFENGNVIYHDSGPKDPSPNRTCSRERFEKAWNLCFFDHDLIIVNQ